VFVDADVDGVQQGIDQPVQQRVLGAVVIVDGSLGDAEDAGKIGDRGAGKPAPPKSLQRQAGDAAVQALTAVAIAHVVSPRCVLRPIRFP
jgi:hypothetical protein